MPPTMPPTMPLVIDIATTAQAAGSIDFTGTTAIVIDVLRATTSIHCVLHSGGKIVYPVAGVDAARMMKKELPDALLCGERGGLPPAGFDMGNSPADFAAAELVDKDVILTTTNGTQAVANASGAGRVIASSMVNAISTARYAAAHSHDDDTREDIFIICAGTEGAFSIEDFYCAGLIVSALVEADYGAPTDLAWAAAKLTELPLETVVNNTTCKHIISLTKAGFARDLSLALRVETAPYDLHVPVLDTNTGGFVLSG